MGFYPGEIDIYGVLDNLHRMPKQQEFIKTPAQNAAYVGGQGSGKSVSLCTSIILNSMADPHGFSLVGRLNMPALEASTMKTFLEMVPENQGEWADTKKMWKFSNGHEVIFKHLDISDPKIVGHVKSMNLSAAYVDEATEISEEVYFLLIGRLRRKTAPRHIIRLSSNPAGHDWVWRQFFDPDRKEKLKANVGITASTMDNPFLPEEYVQNLLNTYPPDWAERFIYGHFSDFSDLVYKEYSDQTHTWDHHREHAVFGGEPNPPESWPIIIGIDIGSDIDPWAIVFIAVAPDGRLYQYDEVYGNCMLISEIAERMKPKMEGRRVSGIAYDYANRQCALELAEHGIAGSPAIKEVDPGLFKCSQYFHIDQRMEHPFNPQIKGSPWFFVSQKCMNSRREVGAYKWAKDRSGNATGEPSHDNSHSPDSIRYALHTFRPLPSKMSPKKLWENAKLDEASRMYWRDQDKIKDRMLGFVPKNRVPKTIQDWALAANGGPKRFRRPSYSRYSRA